MTTITALELRKNLDAIVRRVQAGERFQVTYRNKPAMIISPDEAAENSPEPGTPAAMERFLAKTKALRESAKGRPVFDPNKSVKELYHEMLDNDPKYK